MGIFGHLRGCFCFLLRRSIIVIAWSKLHLDVSFILYDFYNHISLLETIEKSALCKKNDEGDVISCVSTIWIVITPVLKILIDIAFDFALIVGYHKKYAELLRICFAYSVFMAVFHVVGFCSELVLLLRSFYNIYFLSVMPYVAMLFDWEFGMTSNVLAWLLWISYVGVLCYLPFLVKTEIQKLEPKYELSTNAGQESACHQSQGILYAPRRLGLVKMLMIKEAVAVMLVMYLTYFSIGMCKLKISKWHAITVLVLIIPLLMVDVAFNIVLYCGHNKDKGLLRVYYSYSMYARLVNAVTALAIKYYEFIFCILQEEWFILLYNFHMYLILWMVYVVVHFYVEILAASEIANMGNSNFMLVARPRCPTQKKA